MAVARSIRAEETTQRSAFMRRRELRMLVQRASFIEWEAMLDERAQEKPLAVYE
ncbi:MAG TPA: hypothetical protein VN039_11715 [Nitrospira sp.]|nr:hypothetical protein [Nitrospira sp.]